LIQVNHESKVEHNVENDHVVPVVSENKYCTEKVGKHDLGENLSLNKLICKDLVNIVKLI